MLPWYFTKSSKNIGVNSNLLKLKCLLWSLVFDPSALLVLMQLSLKQEAVSTVKTLARLPKLC